MNRCWQLVCGVAALAGCGLQTSARPPGEAARGDAAGSDAAVALPPGTPYWSVAYGAAESGDEAHAIAVDPDGDLFVAGQFHEGLSFGGPVLADDGSYPFRGSHA